VQSLLIVCNSYICCRKEKNPPPRAMGYLPVPYPEGGKKKTRFTIVQVPVL
jgi:hypothetical protein